MEQTIPNLSEAIQENFGDVNFGKSSLGMTGQSGAKASSKAGDLLDNPSMAEDVNKGLPARIKENPYRKSLPNPQDAGQSSGPVIKLGNNGEQDPFGFLKESKQKMGGTNINNEKGSLNPSDNTEPLRQKTEEMKTWKELQKSNDPADKRNANKNIIRLQNEIKDLQKGK